MRRKEPPTAMWRACRRFGRDDRGAIIIFVGLALVVLTGFAALGVETGLWWATKRYQQTAADYAALSGAMEIAAGMPYYRSATTSGICGLAERDAARNGFTFASYTCPNATPACTTPSAGQMCANNPPVVTGGAHVGDANYVEVILAEQHNTTLASFFLSTVTITTRAVAGVTSSGFACTLALAPTGSKAIDIAGNTTLNMNSCGIASDSTDPDSINFQGSATLNASWFQTSGNYNTTGNP